VLFQEKNFGDYISGFANYIIARIYAAPPNSLLAASLPPSSKHVHEVSDEVDVVGR